MTPLADRFGRVATDLRVSLTDRCNLRCTYCMPEEGLRWLPRPELLTDDEIVRLVTVAVRELGVTEVRFTGGEPLLRPGLVSIVERCAALTPRPRLSLTSNGIGLERVAPALRAAGLRVVLEAIRWVMGESSARSMRGGGMEDVIFAGTTSRPARDFAEVTILIDGATPDDPVLREIEVVRLTAAGHSNKEIAAQLELSVKTVESYKALSLEKLGLHSRADLVRYALQRGWLRDA